MWPLQASHSYLDAAVATSEEAVDLAIVDIDELEDIVDRFVGLVDEDNKLTLLVFIDPMV